MINKLEFTRIYPLQLGVFALIMVLFPKAIALGFLLFLITLVIGGIQKEISFQFNAISLLFISLYFLYAFYASYTRNSELAFSYLENKLSFLILPMLFVLVPKKQINYYWTINGFVFAALVLSLQNFVSAVICYTDSGAINCFFSSAFSYKHHPTYAAVYFLMAMILLLYGWRKKLDGYSLKIILIPFVLLMISYFLCLSLAGILYIFIVIAVSLFYLIYVKWGKIVALLTLILMPVAIYSLFMSIPQIEGEISSASHYVEEYVNDPENFVRDREYPMSGSEVRIVMWTAAYNVFKMYPLGVGTGNVDAALNYELRKLGQPELTQHNYNPHNQFLQTGIEIGWFGVGILLGILSLAIYWAAKYRNWILLFISTSLFFNALVESMLQRQSGIVFYTFALCLLANVVRQEMIKKRQSEI